MRSLMLAAPAASASTVHLTPAEKHDARHELTAAKAAVLGVVEGITEFLPISSTGHLLYAERLMDVGNKKTTKDAADTYTIVIQLGAILAVIVLFWGRIVEIFQGLLGRSAEGRRLLVVLLLAFLPAAVIGLALEKKIKDHLLEPWPVIVAWLVGGIAIFVIGKRLHQDSSRSGKPHRRDHEPRRADHRLRAGARAVAGHEPQSRDDPRRRRCSATASIAAVEFSFILGLAHARRGHAEGPRVERQAAHRRATAWPTRSSASWSRSCSR